MDKIYDGTELFVFSGTGNSLDMARKLLEGLGGGRIRMINSRLLEQEKIESKASLVGIVFPVYFLDLPAPVKMLLNRIELPRECRIFALATCGQLEGPVLDRVDDILAKKGHSLESGFIQYMPGNSILFHDSEEDREEKLRIADGHAERVVSSIREGNATHEGKGRKWHRAAGKLTRWSYYNLYRVGTKKALPEECIGCGLCARVCPMENIVMEDLGEENPSPRWKSNCAECFACIHWCSTQAVRAGRLRVDSRTRYTHPRVRASQLGCSGK